MAFDYDKQTRRAYRSKAVATRYHTTIDGALTWLLLPARIVAARERVIVKNLMAQAPHRRVVDIPTGTGKLARVFSEMACDVLALDISEEMLALAKSSFQQAGHGAVTFGTCDAESLQIQYPGPYDLSVCLRLLHRVPTDKKEKILSALSSISHYAIVSFGVKLWHEPIRSSLRRAMFGARAIEYCEEQLEDLVEMITPAFEVVRLRRILPFLSREVIFLLRSKRFNAR